MKSWKFYANYVKRHPSYKLSKDKSVEAPRRKKAKKFKRKWGFDCGETWNLDMTLATFLLPRIAFLRDNHNGHPGCFCKFADDGYTITNGEEAAEEWNNILDTIVEGLYLYISNDNAIMSEEDQVIWNKAKEYICKYWDGLWD